MQFGWLTKTVLILPTTALFVAIAHYAFLAVPSGQSRRGASIILLVFGAAYLVSFAGAVSASNAMRAEPKLKTFRNVALFWYGLVPHIILAAFLVFLLAWGIFHLASST